MGFGGQLAEPQDFLSLASMGDSSDFVKSVWQTVTDLANMLADVQSRLDCLQPVCAGIFTPFLLGQQDQIAGFHVKNPPTPASRLHAIFRYENAQVTP